MLRSELVRLRYSQVSWTIAIGLIVVVVAYSAFIAFLAPLTDLLEQLNEVVPNATDAGALSPETLEQFDIANRTMQLATLDFLGAASSLTSPGAVAAVALGLLTITTEYRFGSVVAGVLAQPSRIRYVLGKAAALSVVLAGLAVLLATLTTLVLVVALQVQGAAGQVSLAEGAALLLRDALALVWYGWFGFGLGLLLRGQVLGLLTVGSVLLAESVLRPVSLLLADGFTPVQLLPFGLAQEVVGLAGEFPVAASESALPRGLALLVVGAWGLGTLLAGARRFARTDIVVD